MEQASRCGTRTYSVETGRQKHRHWPTLPTTRLATGLLRLNTTRAPLRRQHPGTELPTRRLGLNLDINPRRQRQLVQSVNRLAGGLNDVNEPFMRADFKLLPRLLIDVRAARLPCNAQSGWKRMGPRSDVRGSVDNFRRRLIQCGMIVPSMRMRIRSCFFPALLNPSL